MSEKIPPQKLRIATHMVAEMLAPVRAAFPEVEVVTLPVEGELPPDLEAEILLTLPWGTPNLADALACGVKWVHAYGTGVNGFPFEVLKGVPLSCSRGASATPISEWVIAVLLAAEKQLPQTWLSEPPERWNIADLGTLSGSRLALIGFGAIAQAIARRALPFGMKVRGFRRTGRQSSVPEVEIVTSLEELLCDADHVVVAAPETPATRHMLNDESFALMKPGVHVVNIARGGLIDQAALARALDSGRVGLATLDCVDPEPLPEGHWLYSHPKVRLSAHISWSSPESHSGLMDRFVENLARYHRGEALDYLVDPVEQY
ncbi:MAG: dihydrofolate reductase [bacterium]|nr:dihydrofolate reductase [bacterium]